MNLYLHFNWNIKYLFIYLVRENVKYLFMSQQLASMKVVYTR